MKIETPELFEINSLMENYRKIHQNLLKYENILDEMESGRIEKRADAISLTGSKIRECIKNLELERLKEREFYKKLEIKYGPGELDVRTFEYRSKDAVK